MNVITTGTAIEVVSVEIDITSLPTDLKTIKSEPGVSVNAAGHKLPMRVLGPFCQAIRAERQGDAIKAWEKLLEACQIEEEMAATGELTLA